MEKKSKVIKITKFDKQDQYGNTSYSIELENGDKGFYSSKSSDQKNFVIGNEATYLIEEKTGKEGKVYFKITLPKTEGGHQGAGGKSAFVPQDPKIQMISFAMAYTKDLVVAGKIEMRDLKANFNVVFDTMISKFNEIKQ